MNLKKLIITIFLFSITGFSPCLAQANYSADQDFKKLAIEIPSHLINSGYKRIGELDLDQLNIEIQTMNIEVLDWVETKVDESNLRIFARWQRDQNGIVIRLNEKVWNKSPQKFKSTLALHEALGGAGYDDSNYNLSTSLWLLREVGMRNIFNPTEINFIVNHISEISKRNNGGGIVGVGGGGDLIGPELKITMLMNSLKKFEENPSSEGKSAILTTFIITQSFNIEGSWKFKK